MTAEGQESPPRLALVVGAARSGTTLQRVLLNAHPDIGCPAEAGLPALMAHMSRVWGTMNADALQDGPVTDPGRADEDGADATQAEPSLHEGQNGPVNDRVAARLPAAARSWIRDCSLTAMASYCAREGKRVYVDKSLDSVYHLDLVRLLFPDVRCILVFRHVMDTIASGIEASPFGFQAYGYAPYVQRFPGNSVAALGAYWLDHVTASLKWETANPGYSLRVKYEDLVTDPKSAVASTQRFLGVPEDLSVLAHAFDRALAPGPADYKVEHTTSVHTASIGHGKRLPVSMLPPRLLSAINDALEKLGYPVLDRSWNAAERPVDGPRDTIWVSQLRSLMTGAKLPASCPDLGVFAVVAEDQKSLRWIVDTESTAITHGDGDVDAVLTGTAEDLVVMLTKQDNLGTLLRSGRLRHLVSAETDAGLRPADLMHIKALTAVLQASVSGAQ